MSVELCEINLDLAQLKRALEAAVQQFGASPNEETFDAINEAREKLRRTGGLL